MRMSMAGKIYAIIVLLLVVAVVILGLGVYSMRNLSVTMDTVVRQSKRVTNLANVDKIALQRRITTVDIIGNGDETQMKALIDNDMKNIEAAMDAELKQYAANFDSPPTPTQVEYEQNLRKLWNDYVVVSGEVTGLAYQNTNNAATRVNHELFDFWNESNETLGAAVDALLEDGKHLTLLREALDIRNSLMQYRILALWYIPEHDPAKAAEYLDQINVVLKHISEELPKLAAGLTPELGKAAMQRLNTQFSDFALPKINEVIKLVQQGTNVRAARLLQEKGVPTRGRLAEYTAMVIDSGNRLMANAQAAAEEMNRTMLVTMAIVGVVGIVLAIIIAYISVSGIVRRLNSIIATLGESSTQVNSAAGQISSSAQGLAEGSTEQAASLEQTSSALEEMASMTRQNADNSTKTNDTTQGNNKLIAQGAEAVRNMSQAMGEISDSAEQINRIIKTIEDIAFQTNLLALNAAVEAARAGEAGKGFAVVADEVRNLAGRSAQAARDTTQLIHTTIERVRNGSEIASELDSSFKEIEEGSHTVARLISEITSATNEQAQGVDQVNTAVAQMDKVTQQNAASAEEAASAAEELSAQASALNGMVDDLVSMVEGKGGGDGALVKSNGKKASGGGRGAFRAKKAPRLETTVQSAPSYSSSSKQQAKVVSANDVIPLDENDDF